MRALNRLPLTDPKNTASGITAGTTTTLRTQLLFLMARGVLRPEQTATIWDRRPTPRREKRRCDGAKVPFAIFFWISEPIRGNLRSR